jgi:hypothetical protein
LRERARESEGPTIDKTREREKERERERERESSSFPAPYFTHWYIMDLCTYHDNMARAGRVIMVHKSIMLQFVKFCLFRFGQLNMVISIQKIVWALKGIPKHDNRRKEGEKCNFLIFFDGYRVICFSISLLGKL